MSSLALVLKEDASQLKPEFRTEISSHKGSQDKYNSNSLSDKFGFHPVGIQDVESKLELLETEVNRLLKTTTSTNPIDPIEDWKNKYNSINTQYENLLKTASSLKENLKAAAGVNYSSRGKAAYTLSLSPEAQHLIKQLP